MRVPNVGEEFGRYRLDRVVGRGGMGVVFAATDLRLNRTVALKVITGALAESPDFRARFQAEASVLARLDSPYVIAIHDHDEVDGTPYIVTQFVDGTDLKTLLRTHGPMPARQALLLCAQLARGLGDAHRAGVIHRDVKPANVLLRGVGTDELHGYLCDFGIARADGDEAAPTTPGSIAGTWSYLSPERTIGGVASPASDLYALGCLLWTCLTGQDPYQGTDVQIAVAHQQAPIPRLPGSDALTEQLNAVIARAMAKDPAQRYSDAATLRADLERLAAMAPDRVVGSSGATPPPPPPPASGLATPPPPPGAPTSIRSGASSEPRRSRARIWVPIAVVLALLLVGGGVAAWLALDDDPADATGDPAAAPTPSIEGDLTDDGLGDVLIRQDRFDALSPLSTWTVPSSGLQFGSPQQAPAEPGRPILGDVDGDGRPDVVWLEEDDEIMRVVVVPGDGEKWTADLPIDPAFEIKDYNMSAGDVDGDGKDDLVLYADPSDEVDALHVALAEDGGFADPTQWYAAELISDLVKVGDLDGDGQAEVALFGENAEEVDVLQLLRPEDGAFRVASERVLSGSGVNPLLAPWMIGDVDGDGAAELVAPNATRRAVFVYDLEGDEFGARTRWHQTQRTTEEAREQLYDNTLSDSTLSDVDGDGDADLVELHEPAEGTEELRLVVLLSDGASFGDPEAWGTVTCGKECSDAFWMVD